VAIDKVTSDINVSWYLVDDGFGILWKLGHMGLKDYSFYGYQYNFMD
jgi:hypothetical protein